MVSEPLFWMVVAEPVVVVVSAAVRQPLVHTRARQRTTSVCRSPVVRLTGCYSTRIHRDRKRLSGESRPVESARQRWLVPPEGSSLGCRRG